MDLDDVDDAILSTYSSSFDNDLVRIDYLGKLVNKNGIPTGATAQTCTSKVRARIEAELLAMSKAVATRSQSSICDTNSSKQENDGQMVVKSFNPRVGLMSKRHTNR